MLRIGNQLLSATSELSSEIVSMMDLVTLIEQALLRQMGKEGPCCKIMKVFRLP